MKKWKLVLGMMVLAFSLAACGGTKEPGEGSGAVSTESVGAQDVEQGDDAQDAALTENASRETQQAESEENTEKEPEKEPEQEPEPEYSIKRLFAEYDLKAGTCLTNHMISNKACVKLIKENFNSITFENDMKPDYILDQKASKAAGDLVVKFNNNTIKLLDWCKENDMAVRGHVLIWHSQTPNWIFYEDFNPSKALVSRDVMLARMESYIKQTFELIESLGYSDMFYAYDVVNEAWMEDGTKRDSLWLQTIGDDYMWHAFSLADKYAPEHIDLYYNDYNEQFKTETLYDFVQTLVDEEGNYLIDGIGFQAHLYTEDSQEEYFATMDRLASLGLKVCLTELDVCLGSWPEIKPATDANFQVQGQYYYNLIGGILERIEAGTLQTDSLTFWGTTDSLSWRKERHPMLFTSMYKPKYAYFGVVQEKEKAGFTE